MYSSGKLWMSCHGFPLLAVSALAAATQFSQPLRISCSNCKENVLIYLKLFCLWVWLFKPSWKFHALHSTDSARAFLSPNSKIARLLFSQGTLQDLLLFEWSLEECKNLQFHLKHRQILYHQGNYNFCMGSRWTLKYFNDSQGPEEEASWMKSNTLLHQKL